MRITNIVQRQGERVFYGDRDGWRVSVSLHGDEWAVRDSDGRIVDTGALVEVLGIQLRDEWRGPRGESCRVTGLNSENGWIEMNLGTVAGSAILLLELGWRPEAR